jgi:hypothetical protein
VKDQNYFRDKSWNNSYYFSDKIFKYFHKNNLLKGKMMTATQQQWDQEAREKSANLRDDYVANHKEFSKSSYDRIVLRRTDLQVQSGQAVIDGNIRTISKDNFTSYLDHRQDPVDYKDLAEVKQIDPPGQSCMLRLINKRPDNLWNRLIEMNKKKLKSSITNSIMKMDEKGFKAIQERTEKEQEAQQAIINRKRVIYCRIRGGGNHVSEADSRVSKENMLPATSTLRSGKKARPSIGRQFDNSDCAGLYVNDITRVKGFPDNNYLKYVLRKSQLAKNLKQKVELEHSNRQSQVKRDFQFSKNIRTVNESKEEESNLTQLDEFDKLVKVQKKFAHEAKYPQINLNQIKKFVF